MLTPKDRFNARHLALAFQQNNVAVIAATMPGTPEVVIPVLAILGENDQGQEVYWPYGLLVSDPFLDICQDLKWPTLQAPIDLSVHDPPPARTHATQDQLHGGSPQEPPQHRPDGKPADPPDPHP